MATTLDFSQVLQRAFDESAQALKVTVSGAVLEVNLDNTDDDVLVYGFDGVANKKIKTDAAGELQIDVLSSALPAGAATEATLVGIAVGIGSIDSDIDVSLSSRASELTLSSINTKLTDASQKTQIVDGVGSVIGSTSNALDVNIKSSAITLEVNLDNANDDVLIYGFDGAVNRAIKTDAAGELQIDVLSSALPAGAATEATLSSINGKLNSLGQKVMTASVPVVIASDQSTVKQSQTGRSVVTTTRNDYSSSSVTTAAWSQLIASTAADIHEIEIFDSSGQTLELGTGAAAAETRLLLVFPGGNGRVQSFVVSGTRISIRAVSANATVGESSINYYGAGI